jgi:hypothetical protein
LIGKYESSANAEAVAHQRAQTKRIAFTGFAYPHIAQELFPKLRVPTGIYHNSVPVPDKSGYWVRREKVVVHSGS